MDSATQADPTRLLEMLLDVIRPRQSVLTAFSGGVDSTLVAAAARRVLGRDRAPAAVGDSASLPRRELAEARSIARQLDLRLIEVHPREQDDLRYQQNSGDRCYFCKNHLYETLRDVATETEVSYIANGTNVDDLADHRPGLEAARQAQVIWPLVDAGFGKAQVRAVAHHLSLPNWDKPAAACLASRVPYGTPVTLGRLQQIEQAEDALRCLGFSGFRVRHHEQVARIELPPDQIKRLLGNGVQAQVVAALKEAGYLYICVDLEGFRSGSGNAILSVQSALT